jgi:dTDP-D-glucose 4,6-dehydratase
MGWSPEISLEEGLQQTYQWIEQQVNAKLEAAKPESVLV